MTNGSAKRKINCRLNNQDFFAMYEMSCIIPHLRKEKKNTNQGEKERFISKLNK